MNRFQLSLRDVLIVVTVLCVQLALFALFFQLTDDLQEWLVSGLFGISYFAVPIALAVAIADLKNRLPLLSAVVGLVMVIELCAVSMTNDPFHQAIVIVYGDDLTLSGFVVWHSSLLTGLLCAWITRSLIPR